jgi:ferredoxin
VKEFRHLENIVTLEYYPEKCVGCGACSTVCPHGVFIQENDIALLVDRDGCMECGACALNCPTRAIDVRSGVGCAQAILYGWLSAIPFLRKLFVPDACCI